MKILKILLVFTLIIGVSLFSSDNSNIAKVEAASVHLFEKYETTKKEEYRLQCVDQCNYMVQYTWSGSSSGYSNVKVDPNTGEITPYGEISYESYYIVSGNRVYSISVSGASRTYRTYSPMKELVDSKGTYLGIITGSKSNSYPNNNKHTDGYWYVYKGVTNIPTITISTPNNHKLSEVERFNKLNLTGTAKDLDVGDTLRIKYSIDSLPSHQNREIGGY